MAKVINRPGIRTTLRYTGIMHTATLAGGRTVFKKWPPKRGKTPAGPVADMRQAFAWAAKASVYAIDKDKIVAEEWSKGSMYYPRDILVSAMYGTLITVRTKEGVTYYPARTVPQNIQLLLDTITKIPGSFIVRGVDEWVSISPGAEGQVITSQGPGLIPVYADPAGGGGGGISDTFLSAPRFDPQTAAAAGGAGVVITQMTAPANTYELNGVSTYLKSATATQITPVLYEADATGSLTGATLVATGPTRSPVLNKILEIPFTAPYLVVKGLIYWAGYYIGPSGTFTTPLQPSTTFRYFAHTTGAIPTTAPATTAGSGTNFGVWGN